MRRRVKILVALVVPLILPAVAQGAQGTSRKAAAPLEREYTLIGGPNSERLLGGPPPVSPALPVFTPSVAAEPSQEFSSTDNSRQIDGNTCRYYGSSHVDGGEQGGGNYAVGTEQEAFTRAASVRSAFSPGQDETMAWAEAGVSVDLSAMRTLSSVRVFYPWHSFGNLDVDTEVSPIPLIGGTSDASASYLAKLVLKNATDSRSFVIVDARIGAGFPGTPHHRTVDRDYQTAAGDDDLRITANRGDVVRAFVRGRSESFARSVAGANARGESDWYPESGITYTSYQDWHFNLDPGWTIASC